MKPSTLTQSRIDLATRGINKIEAAELRARLSTFAEDWNRPEMDIYDEEPTKKVASRQ
jgi:hypothetical protein